MRIGSRQIEGVEPRFFIFLGIVIALLGAGLYFWATRPEPPAPDMVPAFPPEELPALENNWLDEQIEAYGILPAADVYTFIDDYALNVGQPFRLKVMLPSVEEAGERADLSLRDSGWVFRPAIFLDPKRSYTAEGLQEVLGELIEGEPLMLGFPENAQPSAEGGAYEVAAMLYWWSDTLNPNGIPADGEAYPPAPVLLVGDFQALSTPELSAPTTHRALTDVTMRSGPLEVSIPRVEWASGHEVRACVIITNKSARTQPQWPGVTGSTAQIGEGGALSEPSAPVEGYSINAPEIAPGQSVAGYLSFPSLDVIGAPGDNLFLNFPSLNPDHDHQQFFEQVVVTPDQFVAQDTERQRNAGLTPDCGSTAGAIETGFQPLGD